MSNWFSNISDEFSFNSELSILNKQGKVSNWTSQSEILNALMYPKKDLLDKFASLQARQGKKTDDETIFVAACACCLEAFSLGVGDNLNLLGGTERVGEFWNSFVWLLLGGMPWTYKNESIQTAIEAEQSASSGDDFFVDYMAQVDASIKRDSPEVDRIRSRIHDAWSKVHKAFPNIESRGQATHRAAAKMACLLIDSNESNLEPTKIELFADLINNKRALARAFVRRVKRQEDEKQQK